MYTTAVATRFDGISSALEEDALLVLQSKANLSEFSELYERYATRVYRYLLVQSGNVQDAQDLTSQTFLAAMKSLQRYDGSGPFIAWLLGIARHKLADQYHRSKPIVDLDETEEIVDSDALPETLVDRRLTVEAVQQKLRVISPDRAEAISLRLFAGLEVGDIAVILGKSEPAVRMLIYRGLHELREKLAGLYGLER